MNDNDLPYASPESQGVASSAIVQFVEAVERQIREMHSFMLLRHGRVIAEGWWHPYDRQHPHMLFSLSKSFTSTAVGLAVNEGYFSIDDAVLSFFPEAIPAEMSERLAGMQVRHLLTMCSGHEVDTWAFMEAREDGNWTQAFFDVPIVQPPGTHFVYNTGATYLLSAIVQRTTGMKVVDYLKARLFEPLGIEGAAWDESPEGINLGGIGLHLRTEDIARFGQLYLQKGRWQGVQIIPEAWVEAATSYQMANGDLAESDWAQGYGYQFWRCRHGAYRGDGVFGQYCIVMPEQDAVLAITGGMDVFDMQEPLDMVWDMLLPAMREAALPEDGESQRRLSEKSAGVRLHPAAGRAASPLSGAVSGRVYRLDANALKIEAITLDFHESGCTARIQTGEGEETIPCGYGDWQQGQTTLFNAPWLSGFTPVVSSGAWTADDCYTLVARLYQTPFYHTLDFHFAGDELMVETRVNVSLDGVETVLLMGRGG